MASWKFSDHSRGPLSSLRLQVIALETAATDPVSVIGRYDAHFQKRTLSISTSALAAGQMHHLVPVFALVRNNGGRNKPALVTGIPNDVVAVGKGQRYRIAPADGVGADG